MEGVTGQKAAQTGGGRMSLGRTLFMACALAAGVGRIEAAESPVEWFLEGLRQRELFSLAEGYCLRRLARSDLRADERLPLVLQLSRTYSDHARRTTGAEQEDLWRRARSVITEEIDRTTDPSVRLPLEVQLLLVSAAQARHLRWQWELAPFNTRRRDQALQMLRPLVPQLLEKEKALTELLRAGRAASRPKTRGVRPHELRSLLLHLRLGLLQALLDRAELLPKHSPDRTSSLLEAERCAKRLDSGVLSSAAKWDRDLLLARVYRLQGRYREAERILQALEARQPSRLGSDQVLAEKARLLIDQDRVPDAADLLAARHRSGPRMPGELQFLFVRCLVVLWQAAREKHQAALAEQLRQHITLLIEQADASDPYWADRCRRLLDRVDTTGRLGERLATMIERAKGAFASGDMQGAAAAYREAAEAAREEGRTDVAGDLIYTAASIELKRGHYEQAAAVLAGFPSRFPAHRRAAEAHLLSAFALAKLYQQAVAAGKRNEAAKLRRQYADALERHREKFHGHPTWAEATWMLAVLNESEGQYEEALSLYGQIPSSDRRVADAEVGIARCYEAIVETLRRQHQPDDQWRRSAIAHLERFAGRFPPEPQPLSVQQAEVAVRLAQLLAGGRPPEFRRADRLLERAIASLRRHVARARPS
ncbi:MAG TPA: hypothetical protein EYP14_11925, partial [Planctomycetaceae bacterium]|nr:hypothetical protein [Planctomycetaceae bacterium]